jgi:subtilisin family serine protease
VRRVRRCWAGVVTLALVVGMAAAVPDGAQAAPALDTNHPPDKIEPALQESLAAGESGFWVRFAAEADLSRAWRINDWTTRGVAVAGALRETAQTSQVAVRETLDGRRVDYQAFWATNAIFVHSGQPALAQQIAAHPEVQGLYAPTGYELVEPTPGVAAQQVDAIEWGIASINADDVWDQFGVRGEGITIASLDTGVQFDHPALVNQYRGNLGDGTFDHDYNWFDATGDCPDAPCDFDNHGTHTMGTMVGDDGDENQIGVAPEANWITTNGCCPSDAAVIAAGQWLLEPTDLRGENPDASKRPHIINNSWGTLFPSTDPFMDDVIEAWDAAGILAIWSAGNLGDACHTSGSPGSRTAAYSVGAHDIDDTIADFSGRGPGQDGQIKPNITAPGVGVRSSVTGDSYEVFDGTSMAAPHVAGAVALLWSAAPALVGDTDATIALLDQTAIDTEDLQCGGTADDNNVYGEGRLDALGLVQRAPIGATGIMAGTVTDAATGDPITGATLAITGPLDREVRTGPDGSYSVALLPGDYTVNVSAFGYRGQTAELSIAAGQTTTADFALVTAARVTVSGTIRDGSGHGWPVYAKVRVQGVPEATTYSSPFTGRYRLTLPAGATHTLVVEPQYPGYRTLHQAVPVGDRGLIRDLRVRVDAASCSVPGYGRGTDAFAETFDAETLPAGWSVVDNVGNETCGVLTTRAGRETAPAARTGSPSLTVSSTARTASRTPSW